MMALIRYNGSILVWCWCLWWTTRTEAFSFPVSTNAAAITSTKSSLLAHIIEDHDPTTDRRGWVRGLVGTTVGIFVLAPDPSWALPLPLPEVSTSEFESILKQSARSIQTVEFRGPRSESTVVTLVDGTSFRINDVVESPTDPRSPLQIAALCKAYNVPVRYPDLATLLAGNNNGNNRNRKKVFRNASEREAAVKEAAKRERIRQDEREQEQERLRALYELQGAAGVGTDL